MTMTDNRQAIKNKLWQTFQDWDESNLLIDTEIEDFLGALEGVGLKLVEVENNGCQHTYPEYGSTGGLNCLKCGSPFLT